MANETSSSTLRWMRDRSLRVSGRGSGRLMFGTMLCTKWWVSPCYVFDDSSQETTVQLTVTESGTFPQNPWVSGAALVATTWSVGADWHLGRPELFLVTDVYSSGVYVMESSRVLLLAEQV